MGDIKKNVYRLVVLLLWLGLFYGLAYSEWFIREVVWPAALMLAGIVNGLLQLLGNETLRTGTTITGSTVILEITYKCTGVYQLAAYLAATAAFPADLHKKLEGLVQGVCLLGLINIFRIISIFYIACYLPRWVPLVHDIIWEGLMIVATLLIWLNWTKSRVGLTSFFSLHKMPL